MANGDLAAARGWTTFSPTQDRKLGYDNDNYGLDRAAEQAARLDVVEAAVNQPIFAIRRGTNAYQIAGGTWVPVTATPYASTTVNIGFGLNGASGWASGQLTIAKPGLYRVGAHLQFEDASYNRTAVAVVKNTTEANDANTLARNVTGGDISVTTASEVVRLVAGDVLRVLAFQRDAAGNAHAFATGPADFSLNVEWLRA